MKKLYKWRERPGTKSQNTWSAHATCIQLRPSAGIKTNAHGWRHDWFFYFTPTTVVTVYMLLAPIQQASSEGKNNGVTFSYRYATSSSDGKSQLFTACSCKKRERERDDTLYFFRPNRISSPSNLLIPGCWENPFLFGNLLRKREDEAGMMVSPQKSKVDRVEDLYYLWDGMYVKVRKQGFIIYPHLCDDNRCLTLKKTSVLTFIFNTGWETRTKALNVY